MITTKHKNAFSGRMVCIVGIIWCVLGLTSIVLFAPSTLFAASFEGKHKTTFNIYFTIDRRPVAIFLCIYLIKTQTLKRRTR